MPSLSQTSLALTLLVSAYGTLHALTPPRPNTNPNPSSDALNRFGVTTGLGIKVVLLPMGLLLLHTVLLVLTYPNIPSSLLRHASLKPSRPSRLKPFNPNTPCLNPSLITWSPSTLIPLLLIFTTGIPLRLVSYSTLGKNFTFALASPDHLNTGGIYAYVQHPSYAGVVVLFAANVALYYHVDGAMSCWTARRWYGAMRKLEMVWSGVWLGLMVFAIWKRVGQEEVMLREEFGEEWVRWNRETARFVPGVF